MNEFLNLLASYFGGKLISFKTLPTVKDVAVHGSNALITASAVMTGTQPWATGGYRPTIDLYISCNITLPRDGVMLTEGECIDEIMLQFDAMFRELSLDKRDVTILFDSLQSGSYYGVVTIHSNTSICG